MKQALVLCAVLLAAIGSARAAGKVRVSSFSTVLTEIAEVVGGEFLEVTPHVKKGVEPHDFQPTPADLRTVARAQLVLLSARHMEGYVPKLREATGGRARFVEVGDRFPPLKVDGKEVDDPHWWHSVANVIRATQIVREELAKLSPNEGRHFARNAEAYVGKLKELQGWAKREIAKLPRDQRRLVTSHDAFGWFAADHGFSVHPISGLTPEDQPSSRKVAAIIRVLREERVKAIFVENIENPKVIAELTRETGVKIGGTLYPDGLAEEKEAATYDAMMRHNVSTIVNALR